ncbi:MAG: aminotransferase class V-fold PLP-dependent enzyme [Planctomycetota bacterium]|jgi:cysteine desulfurase|nr:aminotransferase class V-fold PLP-dependent enzyme [Planctomycetota bacterium]
MSIYLDNAATTAVRKEVLTAMLPFFSENYGNASAKYYELGKRSRRAVMEARGQVARLLGANDHADEDKLPEVFFTSGATESNNWVIQNAPDFTGKKHLITSSIEHHAVLETAEFMAKKRGCALTVAPVDGRGFVNPADIEKAITSDTALISIMFANNEVGTIEPIAAIAAVAKKHGVLFHTDAVQAAGKVPLDVKKLGVDFLSISGHKFYGPKGVGALYISSAVKKFPAWALGGGQEKHRRAGTYNVPGIVGLGKAAELAAAEMAAVDARERELVERLWAGLSAIPRIYRNGDATERLPNILNVRFDGAEGEAILLRLDRQGIQVASGSACSTDSLEPSHVLLALGVPTESAHGSIRFSLGRETTAADIDQTIAITAQQVKIIRDMSVTWDG